jgi:hypothetical protein
MPSNNFAYPRDTQSDVYTAASFLKRGASIVPAAVGIGIGVRAVLSNTPEALQGLPTNHLGDAGAHVGGAVRKMHQYKTDRGNKIADEIIGNLREGLRDKGNLRQALQSSHEELNAKISAIVAALDEPSIAGDGGELLQRRKEELLSLMREEGDAIDQKAAQMIEDTVKDIYSTATADGKRRFGEHLTKYERLRSQLAPPDFVHKSGQSFSTISDTASLSSRARGQLDSLSGMLRGQGRIDVVKHSSGSTYARVYASDAANARHIMDYPLQYRTMGGVPIIHTGEGLTTPRAADLLYTSARNVQEAFGGTARGATVTRQMVQENLLGTGKAYDYRGLLRGELRSRLGAARGNLSAVENMNEFSRQYLANIDKAAFGRGAFAQHLQAQTVRTHSRMTITGYEQVSKSTRQSQRAMLMAASPEAELAPHGFGGARPFFDPAVGHEFTVDPTGRMSAQVGIRQYKGTGAAITRIRNPFQTRAMYPATMRIDQALKRTESFVPGNNVPSTLGSSGTYRHFGQNIEWADDMVRGGLNKVAVLTPANMAIGLGEGEFYTGGRFVVESPITKTVFDPGSMKTPSSKLLNRLVSEGQISLTSGADINQFFGETKGFLGLGGSGETYLTRKQGLIGLNLTATPTQIGDRKVWEIVGSGRYLEDPKMFGMHAKATSRRIGAAGFGRVSGMVGADILGETGALGLGRSDLIVGPGKMFKKGAGGLIDQMAGAMGLMKKFAGPQAAYQAATQGMYDPATQMFNKSTLNALASGNTGVVLMKTAENVARQMAPMQGQISPNVMGRVFGSLHSYGGKHGVSQDALMGMLGQHFSADYMAKLGPAVQQGIGITPTTLFSGPTLGSWGSTRASMEPRFLGLMHKTLTDSLGMDRSSANDILAGFMARKPGAADALNAAKSLTRMQATISGARSMLDEDLLQSMRRVGAKDFAMAGGSDAAMEKFLRSVGSDFVLDFSGNEFVERAARKAFHNNTSLFIPGSEALNQMNKALIKGPSGNVEIKPEFIRRMERLSGVVRDLMGLQAGASADQISSHVSNLTGWAHGMDRLYGQTVHNLGRGKLAGSAYVRAQSLVFGENGSADFNMEQLKRMQQQYTGAKGHAVFVDSQAFLSKMRDSISAAEKELLGAGEFTGGRARGGAVRKAGLEYRNFFLGSERGMRMGSMSLIQRHPTLTNPHIAPTQVYRVASETGTTDDIFRKFVQTSAGKKALAEVQGKAGQGISLGSFSDMAKVWQTRNRGARIKINKFFQSMASHVTDFMTEEGGGKVFFPEFDVNIHYAGGKLEGVNFSPWAAAGGDHDADMAGMISVFSKKGRELTGSPAAREKLARSVHRQTAEGLVMRSQISEGIARYAGGLSSTAALSPWEQGLESVLKEQAGKDIGKLSTTLGAVRQGIWAEAKPGQELMARQAVAFLGGAEEATQIASKHLSRALDVGSVLKATLDHAMQTGEIDKFESLVRNVLLKGSPILGEGISIEGVTAGKAGDISARMAATAERNLSGQAIGFGEESIDLIRRAAVRAQQEGYKASVTARGIESVVGRHSPQAQVAADALRNDWRLMAAMGPQAGIEAVGEFARQVGNRISTFSRAMDKRFLGPAIVGIGAAVGLGAMVGSPGYSAEPLIAPGEVVTPRVKDAVAAGSLFDQSVKAPMAENFASSDRLNITDRPINPGTAYFERRNAYQIRGGLRNRSAIGEVSNFISGIGGSASIRINDTRRPLTPNYIDRITSE